VRVGNYEFEVLQVADNAIRTVRVRVPTAPKAALPVSPTP
jgi:Mg2+/Co2+ transporter CorB